MLTAYEVVPNVVGVVAVIVAILLDIRRNRATAPEKTPRQ